MDAAPDSPARDTVTIPCHDLRALDCADVARRLVELEPERCAAIVAAAVRHYGEAALGVGDAVSRRWLRRRNNPYLAEIAAVDRAIGRHGAYLLNMSYEWTCTTGTGADPDGAGCRMLRTLDWPLDGLGRNLVVVQRRGAAGDYVDVTWPGFVGVATAMAPGRFAAAINQPPMRRWTSSCWLDWGINRLRLNRAKGLPPMHLLRRVFDEAATFEEARRLLAETPIAAPAFFTLAGLQPDEACVIERDGRNVHVHQGPGAVANHYLALTTPGRDRGFDSPARCDQMKTVAGTAAGGFDWVVAPILNPTTRLACEANAGRGTLRVLGIEAAGIATRPYALREGACAA